MTTNKARIILLGWLSLTGWCLFISLRPDRVDFRLREHVSSDITYYRTVSDRVREGEPYYSILAAELPEWGYPTASVFNWRTPLPMWMIGKLPTPNWGRAVLAVLAVLLLGLGAILLHRDEGRGGLLGILLLTGAALPALLGDLFYFPMLWAGVLIGLSLVAFGFERTGLGIGCGVAAAFFRDIALGYCLLMALYALLQRRRFEMFGWAAGIGAYAIFFAAHAWQVSQQTVPESAAAASDWLQFLGLPFLIATAHMNGWLLLLPQWVAAAYLPAVLLCVVDARPSWQQRTALVVLGYAAVFWAIGQPLNQYWGVVVAPAMALLVGRLPGQLVSLVGAAFPRTGD